MWNGVVTNVGLNLLEQWASGGDVLTIEKATVGTGLVTQTNLRSSTYVQGEVGNAPIVASTPVTGGTQYRVQIQPAQNASYVLHQVGIWAHLGNYGASTLIALYQEEDGISVPLQADQPGFLFTMYAIVTMSNTGEMTVNFDTGAYMTRSDFDAAMENYVTVTTFNTAIAGMVKGVNNGTSTETPDANGVVTLPTDDTPTENSNSYVKSGGVYNALEGKQDTLTFDSSPTQDSTNPVTSGGVYAADAAQDTQIAALKNDLGIVEDGDTATNTISAGKFVLWKGLLYTADAAIASGTTLATSGGNKNLTAVENGGLNALNDKLPKSGFKNITIPAGGSQSETVLFDTAFPAGTSYAVLVTQADQYAYADLYFGSTDRTVNGFKLNGSSNRSASITIQVMWAAIPI